MNTAYTIAAFIAVATDPVPDKENIKAGWVAFGIFIAMAVAVGLLGWSLTRHLKKTKANADAGAFGEVAQAPEETPEES